MLGPTVVFVPSHDLARSRAFYEGVLGLTVVGADEFAIVMQSGATTVRVTAVDDWTPASFTILGWTVADILHEVTGLAAAGAQFRRFDGMDQDEHGVWTSPGGDQVAWLLDPDGSLLSLTQVASQ